jgi:predicted RNA-binding Zn-ribbon protein involved in translation (DUF1610 family)
VSRAGRVEVQLSLGFACARCGGSVTATVRCAGSREALRAARPAVRLACPHCGAANRLSFDPGGRVWGVEPAARTPGLAGPSWN